MASHFIEQLEKIRVATSEGKIIWQRHSPSSYIWFITDSNSKRTNLVLQKTDRSVFFRIWDADNQQTLYEQKSDQTDIENSRAIIALYNFVDGNYKDPGSEILDQILAGIK